MVVSICKPPPCTHFQQYNCKLIPITAWRSHPAQPGEGFDAPPTLERSGSEHRRAVTSLALLERARAWEWVKDPLFARGGQGSRKML